MPFSAAVAFKNPWSLTSRAFSFPRPEGSDPAKRNRDFLSFEGPGINGIGLVRSVAKAYGVLATGGAELGLRKPAMDTFVLPSNPSSGILRDEVLKIETSFSAGFLKPFPAFEFGGKEAFGMNGTGGSIGYADPELQIGFAYAPSNWQFRLFDDPRQKALLDAVKKCVEKLA